MLHHALESTNVASTWQIIKLLNSKGNTTKLKWLPMALLYPLLVFTNSKKGMGNQGSTIPLGKIRALQTKLSQVYLISNFHLLSFLNSTQLMLMQAQVLVLNKMGSPQVTFHKLSNKSSTLTSNKRQVSTDQGIRITTGIFKQLKVNTIPNQAYNNNADVCPLSII